MGSLIDDGLSDRHRANAQIEYSEEFELDFVLKILGISGGVVTGAGIIVFALFRFLGTIQINRVSNNEIHELSKALAKIQADLSVQAERQNIAFNLFFSGQFKTYSDLCSSVVDLEDSVDQLWEGVDKASFDKFVASIKATKLNARKARAFINPDDYLLISRFFEKIEAYRDGKEEILTMEALSTRDFNLQHNLDKINRFVDQNKDLRDSIHIIAETCLNNFGKSLRG